MAKVAVFLKNGSLAPFMECNMVCIYEKVQCGWNLLDTASFPPVPGGTIRETRMAMKEILPLAEGSDAICSRENTGIPFAEFDRAGCCIFSVDRVNDQTLDGILEDIEASDEKKRIRDEIIKNARPAETEEPGIYVLDLIMLQKECPEISSKKALREFLDTVPFLELRIECAHIPPWLEREEGFEFQCLSGDGAVHVVLTKKQC